MFLGGFMKFLVDSSQKKTENGTAKVVLQSGCVNPNGLAQPLTQALMQWRKDGRSVDALKKDWRSIDAALTQHWPALPNILSFCTPSFFTILGVLMGFFHVKCITFLSSLTQGWHLLVPVRTWLDAAGLVPDIPMESFVVETRGYVFKLGVIITQGRKFFL
jgi:hypothetical protein